MMEKRSLKQADKIVLKPITVLIVDDSISERVLIRARLQQLGHHVFEASDGYRASKIFTDKIGKIDLILLDVQMPGINGFETAMRIREFEEERGGEWCPIIFLSGRNEPEDIAQGIESGGDDYLVKPINSIILQAKIKSMQRIADMRHRLLDYQHQLEKLVNIDELTQLPNRRNFYMTLENELNRAKRHSLPFSVAYMDLDYFKQVNDSYGHDAGDTVLQSVAKIISANLRGCDLIGRVGGEEFCFCLIGTDADKVISACNRYRTLIEGLSIQTGDQVLKITASFGTTTFIPGSDDSSSLIARADKALYQAKEMGRNCVKHL
ncbi:MAG: diguanylate cyclase [Gammaproteobacteria bacterium]|nr:diguanylate cyclase [Gammaproteobacteria bacterium]